MLLMFGASLFVFRDENSGPSLRQNYMHFISLAALDCEGLHLNERFLSKNVMWPSCSQRTTSPSSPSPLAVHNLSGCVPYILN